MRILFYKKVFNRDFSIYSRLRIGEIPHILPQGVEVYFSNKKEDLQNADVVIFDIPFLRSEYLQMKKPVNQIWVGWLLESIEVYPWIPDVWDRFDFVMSYLLDSDIPIPYFNYSFLTELRTPPVCKTKNICSFIGSTVNQSQRVQYLDELWKYIDIDSFGRRKNVATRDRSYQAKLEASQEYRFSLAFENSIYDDYVTEKFFDPLLVGSVPIYLGAGNIDKFAPADDSYINAGHYSPKDLATLLLELIHDEERYHLFLDWKEKPFREDFVKMLEDQKEHFILKLIRKINGN